MDSSELYDDVSEKKAIPELILKQNIINAQDSMLLYERNMMNNFRYRNRFYKVDIINFEGSIVLLFGFLKEMIKDSGLKTDNDKKIYSLLLKAELGKLFSAVVLIHLKNFLIRYLHILNLTNLFISGGKGFKGEIEDDFG